MWNAFCYIKSRQETWVDQRTIYIQQSGHQTSAHTYGVSLFPHNASKWYTVRRKNPPKLENMKMPFYISHDLCEPLKVSNLLVSHKNPSGVGGRKIMCSNSISISKSCQKKKAIYYRLRRDFRLPAATSLTVFYHLLPFHCGKVIHNNRLKVG